MNKERIIDIYILDSEDKLVGTVGYFYYSRMTIKELVTMNNNLGFKLRFY